jgi:hypothetical protein
MFNPSRYVRLMDHTTDPPPGAYCFRRNTTHAMLPVSTVE